MILILMKILIMMTITTTATTIIIVTKIINIINIIIMVSYGKSMLKYDDNISIIKQKRYGLERAC